MSSQVPDGATEAERETLDAHIDRYIDARVDDVAEIALKVRATAPPELLDAHLLAFLRLAVRDRMAKRRAGNAIIRGAGALVRHPGGTVKPAVTTSTPTRSHRQRVRDQFAADRARWLADAIWTGDRRVPLGDATVPDLLAAAEHRRSQAAQSVAVAGRYEEIAEVVRTAGVTTVGELPEAKLRELMARE